MEGGLKAAPNPAEPPLHPLLRQEGKRLLRSPGLNLMRIGYEAGQPHPSPPLRKGRESAQSPTPQRAGHAPGAADLSPLPSPAGHRRPAVVPVYGSPEVPLRVPAGAAPGLGERLSAPRTNPCGSRRRERRGEQTGPGSRALIIRGGEGWSRSGPRPQSLERRPARVPGPDRGRLKLSKYDSFLSIKGGKLLLPHPLPVSWPTTEVGFR